MLPVVISLFCGAGGLDWGFQKEGFKVAVAIDISTAAIQTHRRNFPETKAIAADLIELGPEGVLNYVKEQVKPGERLGIIGGPPCQGFSRANVKSLASDPRNELPALYVDIVRMLQSLYIVEFVVFENVLGIRDKKHSDTYQKLLDSLNDLELAVTEKKLCALDFGVPQNRKRIILSAMRKGQGYLPVQPEAKTGLKTVGEAISDLVEPAFFSKGLKVEDIPHHPNHWTMQPKSPRFIHPEKFTSSGRSFRRLSWDKASPTIAYGNREIHVHPTGTRRLSIYEAMLLQGFPETFVLEGNLSEQVTQVSNAVPPPLGRSIANAVKKSMQGLE